MCRELLDFLHLHSRMVSNIRDSSMFPLLLDILLDQFTQDVIGLLQRVHPEAAREPGKLEGIAAFYVGGIVSCYSRLIRENSALDEAMFLKMVEQATKQILN